MALSGTKALEAWCKRVTAGYANVNILNMTTSWRSGLAFCAIIHHHCPELMDFNSLDQDDVFGNNSLAFSVAEQHLGIPSLLDPQDMVECELLDRLSILTYLAQYFQAFSSENSVKANIRRTGSISSSSTSSDLTDAAKLQMKNPLMGRLSDPCKQCGKSVFILERLNVGGKILHRTCFKCARCKDQLTLASFYETETGQFCCEVCPDEENEERQRTLRVNKDLARLMAGDSGESEEDASDTDGSIMSGVAVDKDDEVGSTINRSREDINSNETGIAFTVKYESLEKNLDDLDLETSMTKPEVCDNAAFNENIQYNANVLHLNNNIEEDGKIVEDSQVELSSVCDQVESVCLEKPIEKIEENIDPSDEIEEDANPSDNLEAVKRSDILEDDVKPSDNLEDVEPRVNLEEDVKPSDNFEDVEPSDNLEEDVKPSDNFVEDVKPSDNLVKDVEHTKDSENYPLDKNPFGDDEEPKPAETITSNNDNTSFNPFGSDLDSDNDDTDTQVQAGTSPDKNFSSSNISKPTPNSSLNPFGSDLSSDEEVPRPRVSPTPSTRSTLMSKKKRPAPLPPTQTPPVPAPRLSLKNVSRSSSPGSTLQRKAKAAPVPPAETARKMKDVDNLNRRSQILECIRKTTSPTSTIAEDITPDISVTTDRMQEDEPNKAEEGQWRKKKGPAPPRPLPPKRTVKKLARKAINQELFDIEVKQGGFERQGVKLEKTIREICAASDAEEEADRDSLGPEAEDLIIQLFDLVNEKNELFRRQTELIYMKKENRLEEMHADCEYQIRVLMSKPECQRTDDDKMSEERLIAKLVEIVTQRNEIVDCLEMDRLRELDEDTAIEDHMSNYAAVKPVELPKKGLIKILKRKKKKKDKDDEKDVDTSEVKEDLSGQEKPKKKSARKKLISLASKKLHFPQKK